MTTSAPDRAAFFAGLDLVDHHCHGVVGHELDRATFEDLITEGDRPAPAGTTQFDSQVGFAIRRHCAPVLGLEPFASPEAYLARRAELGGEEVNRRLLGAARTGTYVIETGHRGDEIADPQGMADLAGARAYEVVRLERLAEEIAHGGGAASFRESFTAALRDRLRTAVGAKSIAAYRIGLDFDPSKPADEEVDAAVGAWTAGAPVRLESAVVIRWIVWTAMEQSTVLQFHVGYGDPDVDLHRCSPLLMTEFLRRTRDTGSRVALLHCYPFHREAGFLAQVFPHVWFDTGLAINYVGSRSEAVVAESLELAPFGKLLYSSDAWGAAELYTLGALLFRRGLDSALRRFAELDDWPWSEQRRVAELVASGNARALYRLDERAPLEGRSRS